ncbi:MAG: nuclease [Proteobacteria bacterium]|nr:MAG: nuclease [Pseudomonadota bacterium]PIE67557.1 MAG: nuclease [Deltaproteobacteria bacterium]
MPEVALSIRRLSAGDYQINDTLLVERKTIVDFATSIVDGRLFKQMTRLADAPLKCVIVLEGNGQDMKRIGVRREAMQGALITVGLIMGIPVLRSMQAEETARLLVYAARQMDLVTANGVHRPGYRPKTKRKRQLFILQGLPGVGPKRAADLLDHFGSIQKVLDASPTELAFVQGIGPNTAAGIKDAIAESLASYGVDENLPDQIL